jgi:hypothetical protein
MLMAENRRTGFVWLSGDATQEQARSRNPMKPIEVSTAHRYKGDAALFGADLSYEMGSWLDLGGATVDE